MKKKRKVTKLGPIRAPQSLAIKYNKRIRALIKALWLEVEPYIKSSSLLSDSERMAILDKVFGRYIKKNNLYESAVGISLNEMIIFHNSKFFSTLKRSTGLDLKNILSPNPVDEELGRFIKKNVALIKSIPQNLHSQVLGIIRSASSEEGVGSSDILKNIKREFKVSNSRAKLIANDQTNKTIAALTRVRHQQLGGDDYTWLGSEDSRERPTHNANNNKDFKYSKPSPITGNPGDDVNCRCTAKLIITDKMLHRWAFSNDLKNKNRRGQ